MLPMTTAEQTKTYIGKCKTKGCHSALHISDTTDSPRKAGSVFTFVDSGREATEIGVGYLIGNNGCYARCADHGFYKMTAVNGRYVADIECSDKCRNATGPSCDCSCGGANHGHSHS